ncbi:hypothetical protein [Streptomyces sp. NBC_00470]|uniref:hypothetical protein n=1 Tax=Streptomyces sp. NBC_00470 TaxID=2975753 RepID=UPI002F9108C9
MPKIRVALAAATLGLAAGAGAVATAPAASAASPSSYASLCGSSYQLVGSHAMTRDSGSGPTTGGYVYVFYSSQTQRNCAISKPVGTMKGKAHGLGVGLSSPRYLHGQSDGYQLGHNYTQYAGPVYVKAPHSCINVVGDMATRTGHYSTSAQGVHCG